MPIETAIVEAATKYFWGDEDDSTTTTPALPEEDKLGDSTSAVGGTQYITARQPAPESTMLTENRSATKTKNKRRGVMSSYDPASLS